MGINAFGVGCNILSCVIFLISIEYSTICIAVD